jgi:hypothetical protein
MHLGSGVELILQEETDFAPVCNYDTDTGPFVLQTGERRGYAYGVWTSAFTSI